MRWTEVLPRTISFNVGFIGATWDLPEAQVTVAKRVIAELENRRVLYDPPHEQSRQHSVTSVLEIRRFLTEELKKPLDPDSPLAQHLRAMSAACRKFLDQVHREEEGIPLWNPDEIAAFGEMRAIFGVHLAHIAVRYRLDIKDDLASILPAEDDSEG